MDPKLKSQEDATNKASSSTLPPKPPRSTVTVDNIPADLKSLNHWVGWKYEYRKEKWTKTPYQTSKKKAASTRSATWTTFDATLSAYQDDTFFDGIGFVVTKNDDFVGIDIDHCYTDGQLSDLATEIITHLNTYTEISPSGEGLRLFVRGKMPNRSWKKRPELNLEMYESGRYLTITGNRQGEKGSIITNQLKVDWVQDRFKKKQTKPAATPRLPSDPLSLSDQKLVEIARFAKNGSKFIDLMRGNWEGRYSSWSEADYALVSILSFYSGGNAEQIDRIFRSSGLYREKWDRTKDKTIQNAIDSTVKFYTPRRQVIPMPGTASTDILPTSESNDCKTFDEAFPIDNSEFWEVDDKGKHSLIYHKFHGFLEDNGFARIALGDDGDDIQYKYVRIQDNIVDIVDKAMIKNFVNDYLAGQIPVQNFMKRGSDTYFSPGKLDYLSLIELNILEDTKYAAFYFFRNGIVQVTKDEIKQVGYKMLSKKNYHVWKSSIVDIDIQIGIDDPSEMEEFFQKSSSFGDNEKRDLRPMDTDCFSRKVKTFGYLLHRYKDVSVVRAVVAVDRALDPESQESNGRTGKGLFFEAVRKIRNGLIIPSKDFDINNRFYFQSVKLDHQVINLDDIRRKFDFESLFPWISGDFKVEAKGSGNAQFIIPFKQAPKLLITSNFPLTGKGSSFEARQSVVEFSDYYDDQFQPFDDFGHTFFEDWDAREWLKFYNFAFFCVQSFLEKGLPKVMPDSYHSNKMTALVRPELIEFLDYFFFNERDNEPFKVVEFDDLLEVWTKFREAYDDFARYSTKKLNTLLKAYAEFKGFTLVYGRRSNHRYHYIFAHGSDTKWRASWSTNRSDQITAISPMPPDFSLHDWIYGLPGKKENRFI